MIFKLIRRLKAVERKCEYLEWSLDDIKKKLERQRIANFVWVVEYPNDGRPLPERFIKGPLPPISIEGLDTRIAALELDTREGRE